VIPRDLALAALNSVENASVFPRQFLENAFRKHSELNWRDRAFTQHLVQGVLRWKLRLDWIVGQSVRFPFSKIDPVILNILRIAIYQLFFMDRVPQSAAVNEAVKQAGKSGRPHLTRFVNGILREICRRKNRYDQPNPEGDRAQWMSVVYSYPMWLVKKWVAEMGADSTEDLLEAGNRIPDLVVRTNTVKTDRAGLIGCLEREGLTCRPTAYAPLGVRVTGLKTPLAELSAFRAGLFQVQGEAAQICSRLVGPGPGEHVLEVCAGLGGKSTHMAAMMKDRGRVVALDRMQGRLVSLSQTASRLGLSCIRPVAGDARSPLNRLFRRTFKRVLLDAPCSGLGVLAKHPDGKWARDAGDVLRLAELQSRMLQAALPVVGKNGCLLYTTCTISREENEDVVERLLRENRGVFLENLKERVPAWGRDLVDENGFFRTLPHVHGMEGFFGAMLRKKGS